MNALLLIIASVFFLIGPAFSKETVPPIKKDCTTCHITHAMGAEVLLRAPLSDLCLECHPDRRPPGDHMVDIVPSMPVEKLPLDENGRMTCITCHDPHGIKGIVKMLRASPSKICEHCHKK